MLFAIVLLGLMAIAMTCQSIYLKRRVDDLEQMLAHRDWLIRRYSEDSKELNRKIYEIQQAARPGSEA